MFIGCNYGTFKRILLWYYSAVINQYFVIRIVYKILLKVLIVERIILIGYVIVYITFQEIAADPFSILIEPLFPYTLGSGIAIKFPTMTLN